MDDRTELIAAIEAARPGIFDGEEWLCECVSGAENDPIIGCIACHGTGRYIDLERVLVWLDSQELYPDLARVTVGYVCIGGDLEFSASESSHFYESGETPTLAALACMLAVVTESRNPAIGMQDNKE